MTTQDAQLEKFLAKFPDNATSWAQATDEIRDMAREAKEFYNELDLPDDNINAYPALDFRAIKTPAEWNTKGKTYIRTVLALMSPATKDAFLNNFKEWINS